MPIRPTVAAAAPSNRSAAGRRIRFTSRAYSAESRATGYCRREHETIKEAQDGDRPLPASCAGQRRRRAAPAESLDDMTNLILEQARVLYAY
jgi:hypothetical protein